MESGSINFNDKENKWNSNEYSLLINQVKAKGENWTEIAKKIPTKNPDQCMKKFKNSQRSVKKGNWSPEEDKQLFDWVEIHGPQKWTDCSKQIVGRCGKQC